MNKAKQEIYNEFTNLFRDTSVIEKVHFKKIKNFYEITATLKETGFFILSSTLLDKFININHKTFYLPMIIIDDGKVSIIFLSKKVIK